MEDERKVDPDYLKGFNEGYIIAQHMPELAEQLGSVQNDSIRMIGFNAGREQYTEERLKERLPSWLKGNRSSREQDAFGKSRDQDVEPEK